MLDGILHLRKLGTEKAKVLEENFDKVYDYYKRKAEDMGYLGELKFIKEKSKVLIYTIMEDYDNIKRYNTDDELDN
jgi:hypothetical protein